MRRTEVLQGIRQMKFEEVLGRTKRRGGSLWTHRGNRAGGVEADHATCPRIGVRGMLCSVLMGVPCAP